MHFSHKGKKKKAVLHFLYEGRTLFNSELKIKINE